MNIFIAISEYTLRWISWPHLFIFSFCFTSLNHFFLVGYRCVICQMEYKRGDRRITLPCKHIYHAGCGTRWLCINKVSCWDFHDKVENNMSCGLFSNSLKSWWPSTYRLAPFATLRFLAMHQDIKVIMTDGHKDENSLIFPCFSSLGIFLAHTVVSIKFSFSSVERKDTSFVINQITNFTKKCRGFYWAFMINPISWCY